MVWGLVIGYSLVLAYWSLEIYGRVPSVLATPKHESEGGSRRSSAKEGMAGAATLQRGKARERFQRLSFSAFQLSDVTIHLSRQSLGEGGTGRQAKYRSDPNFLPPVFQYSSFLKCSLLSAGGDGLMGS